MILISHRGNINGRIPEKENHPNYIDNTLGSGYDVEVDVWYVDGKIMLGHDNPQYEVKFRWIRDRFSRLWIHCKNMESLIYFRDCGYDVNYFWHQTDDVIITSKGFLWAYPGKQPINNSIAVLPELYNDNTKECIGVCSDFIINYL
jgi:hypothetical protein